MNAAEQERLLAIEVEEAARIKRIAAEEAARKRTLMGWLYRGILTLVLLAFLGFFIATSAARDRNAQLARELRDENETLRDQKMKEGILMASLKENEGKKAELQRTLDVLAERIQHEAAGNAAMKRKLAEETASLQANVLELKLTRDSADSETKILSAQKTELQRYADAVNAQVASLVVENKGLKPLAEKYKREEDAANEAAAKKARDAASRPKPSDDAIAVVYVENGPGLKEKSGYKLPAEVYLDLTPLAYVTPNTSFSIRLPAGKHRICISEPATEGITIEPTFEMGVTTFIRISYQKSASSRSPGQYVPEVAPGGPKQPVAALASEKVIDTHRVF